MFVRAKNVKRSSGLTLTAIRRYYEITIVNIRKHIEHMDSTRVYVIATDPLARAGLVAMLGALEDIEIVGQGDSASDLSAYTFDVIVWDFGPENESAINEMLEYDDSELSVVALIADESFAATTFASGVSQILPRTASSDLLRTSISSALQGMVAMPIEYLNAIANERKMPNTASSETILTPRESQVIRLLAEGSTNRQIGFDLEISEHTVKFHINSIMGKLGAQSRTEAVVLATRSGLIPI